MTDLEKSGRESGSRRHAFDSRVAALDRMVGGNADRLVAAEDWTKAVKDEIAVCSQVACSSLPLDGRMVRLDSVSKRFDGVRKVTALDNITLEIDRGEIA